MNFKLIRFASKRISASSKNQKFLNFARAVALISVTLGSAALIVSLSVLYGFENELKNKAVKFTAHASIGEFNKNPIKDFDKISQRLKNEFSEIKNIAPKIERESLISSGEYVEGVMISGYKKEFDITGVRQNIKPGNFDFSSKTAKEIVIGERLAKKLNLNIGDQAVLYAITDSEKSSFNFPDVDKFKVVGIYETGMAKYDDIYVYAPFQTVRSFFNFPENSAVSLDVILNDVDKADDISDSINAFLGYPFYSFSVFDIHSSIFAWIEMQKAPIPLVLGLISVVAVFNILTILLIAIVEKTGTIGILRALGMSDKNVVRIFLYQGVSLGFFGALIGCAAGFAFGFLQQNLNFFALDGDIYFLDYLPIKFELWYFVAVIGVSTLLSLLASLIPSYTAARVSPVKVFRFK